MSLTMDEINAQISKIADLRVKEAAAAQAKKMVLDELEVAENKMIEMLIACNMKSHRGPDGMAVISYKTSVKTPKTPEHRAAFFAYLKEQGLYDAMISVNSQTLNSLYKEGLEQAKNDGKDDYQIPGITEVTINPSLSFRK